MTPRRPVSSLAVVGGRREYRAFLLVMVLTALGTSASAPLISLYLTTQLHVTLPLVGLFFASQALPGFALGLLLGRWSDRWRSRLPAIRGAAVWVGMGWLVFAISPWRWLTFAIGPLFLSASGVIMGQVFAALHDVMARDAEPHPSLINTTIRTGWSFGFVFGPLLGSGLAALVGFRAAFVATACLYLLCLVPMRGLRVAVHSSRVRADGTERESHAQWPLYLFTALCTLVLCGTAIKNTYLPLDVTTHLGGSVRLYGTIVAVSPVVELVVMPLCGLLALRMPLGRLIAGGLVVAMVEYLLLAASTALWQLYATQAMDACVVAVVIGLGLTYAQQLSPERAGLVSGIFGSSYGVATVVGNLIGSASVPLLGIPHVFAIPAALCAVSLLTFLSIERAFQRRAARDVALVGSCGTG